MDPITARLQADALWRAALAEARFDPPPLVLSGFFRCECGKLHCRAGVNYASRCTCDRRLWDRAWE